MKKRKVLARLVGEIEPEKVIRIDPDLKENLNDK